jgi:hypothetical protein
MKSKSIKEFCDKFNIPYKDFPFNGTCINFEGIVETINLDDEKLKKEFKDELDKLKNEDN